MAKVKLAPSRFLLTAPVLLLSCWGKGRKPNIITVAWTGIMCSDPPVVYASVRPTRYSHSLLMENGDFVLNVPVPGQEKLVDLCGSVSGRDADKFALCMFTHLRAGSVDAPLIVECAVNLECRTRDILHLGVHDVFIADAVGLQADEDKVPAKQNRGDFSHLVYATGPTRYYSTAPIEGAFYGFSKTAG